MQIKRWLPAVVAPSMIAGAIFLAPLQANAIDLPDLTPLEVLQLAQSAELTDFTGVIVKTTELGLPQLEMSRMVDQQTIDEMTESMPDEFVELIPQVLEQDLLTQAVELIAGTHTVRVYSADEKLRVQILDPMSQRDLIIGESTAWMHDFDKATAYKLDFDRAALKAEAAKAEAEAMSYLAEMQKTVATPQQVVEQLLAAVDESASIEVGIDHRIAGRGAYQLIITPDAAESTVNYAAISVDAETGLGLGVKVFAKGQEEAAAAIYFESLSFETPDASLFEFTAPAGTTIIDAKELIESVELPAGLTEAEIKAQLEQSQLDKDQLMAQYEALEDKPEVLGQGWNSVISVPGMTEQLPMELLENELFADLMVQVDGGKVFSTPLVNVFIADDGKIYAGAVSVDYLISVSR